MRVAVWSARRIKRGCLMAVCIAVAVVLLTLPQAAQTGVRRGLAMCAQLLIPSLFPFLVLSGFIIQSGLASTAGRLAAPFMKRVFGFSGGAAVAMLMSLIGGYPAGANAVAQLCAQGDIDRDEGRRLLRCCVSAGPAFIIGGVGAGMLGSTAVGVRLLLAHWAAFVLVALIERGGESRSNRVRVSSAKPLGEAVTQSVNDAALSLLSMSGFVLVACTVMAYADAFGGERLPSFWRCLLACATEVSTGCTEAATMGRMTPFWIGAALGFGGLSVHGQIAARTASLGLMDIGFWRARCLHALLDGCLSFWFCRGYVPIGASAQTALSAFAPHDPALGMMGAVAVMMMCVVFLCTLPLRDSRT